ncbi:MAG: 6,7-dimethyl-8-ribityllumazine synthase [Rikenellaceae bacterium]|nr:6,7-dimethyl-8-ribityllumazine synthase [Rikenellaceae bacterium]
MASSLKNLSVFESPVPSAKNMSFGIVVAEWNSNITSRLLEGAISLLKTQGCKDKDIIVKHVPGTFELSLGSQLLCEHTDVDAVIALGCVIQGETRHFDFICHGVSQGLNHVALEYNTPVIFGVLTTDNLQQAEDRAGGKHGNKGEEAAATAIKMVTLKEELSNEE